MNHKLILKINCLSLKINALCYSDHQLNNTVLLE